ncbi:MAG: OmpH family outer membrane protein [Candidatus Omnitrophica bacterium]|nr:OmpH family outer membrane protein [Candidatus Omnitrophota bacterium]
MKAFKTLLIAVFATFIFSSFACAEIKLGYVDLSRLFDEYSKTKEYDKVLEEKHKDFQKERNAKIDKINEAQGKLDVLKDEKKKEQEAEVEKMKADLLEFDSQSKTNLTKERNEKIRELLLEIEKVVSNYAEQNKFSMILNDRVLIYGQDTYNLTEDVLKVLNTPAPAEKAK